MLVNAALQIVEVYPPTMEAFGISAGDFLEALPFEDGDIGDLFLTLMQMLRDCTSYGCLQALQSRDSASGPQAPVLLHAHWLEPESDAVGEVAGRRGFALLVSTDVSWPLALDQTLLEVFGLTNAERDIVRALVEGCAFCFCFTACVLTLSAQPVVSSLG